MQQHCSEYSHSALTGEPPISPDSPSSTHHGEDDLVLRQQRRRHTGGSNGRSLSRHGSVGAGIGLLNDNTLYDNEMEGNSLADEDDENLSLRNRNRIEEYEKAMSPGRRSPSEYGFKVVPMPAGYVPQVTVEDFPNEVLTHIFSHLPPTSLTDISLVCRRFHSLITTPHAWRTAFSRYFVGPASLRTDVGSEEYDHLLSQRRSFSRVSALASWRNEYILRSKLLRALSRGKPAEFQPPASSKGGPRTTFAQNINAVTTYRSHVLYPITHIDASFTTASGQKQAQFIHGADQEGLATTSDPLNGKFGIDAWSASSTTEKSGLWLSGWGLTGEDEVAAFDARAGIPDLNQVKNANSITSVWIAKNSNILRLSQGLVAILAGSSTGILTAYSLGPSPYYARKFSKGQITAKWAVCPGVPIIDIKIDDNYSETRQQNGRVWAVVTNALGEVFYLNDMPKPLPTPLVRGRNRLDMTQPDLAIADRDAWLVGRTVEWHLIAPTQRTLREDAVGLHSHNIDPTPETTPRSSCDAQNLSGAQIAAQTNEVQKWLGLMPRQLREIYNGWDMRRKVLADFASGSAADSGESVIVIGCGWIDNVADIKRYSRLRVVDQLPKATHVEVEKTRSTPSLFGGPVVKEPPSNGSYDYFANPNHTHSDDSLGFRDEWRVTDLDYLQKGAEITAAALDCSTFATLTVDEDPMVIISGGKGSPNSSVQNSTTFTTPTTPSTPATNSIPTPSTADKSHIGRSATEIPGQRGRYLAVGTNTGTVIIWDVRTHPNHRSNYTNTITPIAVIHTESPEISSLALTSLYLVHGGNDGLVQAWDPLVSSTKPIRTLNSRFSSRARKHLRFAEDHLQIIGTNWFAANAIVLDPDACSLVGIVALGSHLRFWAYSSSGAEGFKGTKRRTRLGTARHTHLPGAGDGGSGQMRFRNGMRDYIASEEHDMRVEAEEKARENMVLSTRFGVDLLGPGASEEEILAYAQLLSEEAHERERQREREQEEEAIEQGKGKSVEPEEIKQVDDDDGWEEIPPELLQEQSSTSSIYPPNQQAHPFPSGSRHFESESLDDEIDADLAEALRLSLLDAEKDSTLSKKFTQESKAHQDFYLSLNGNSSYTQGPSSSAAAAASSQNDISNTQSRPDDANGHPTDEMDPDLAYAIQLSLAEEESRRAAQVASQEYDGHDEWAYDLQQCQWGHSDEEEEEGEKEEFPALGGSAKNKGKGKARGKGKGRA
ncbi:F-box domain, Skp2-like protein [Ascosphaera apis ARSEF 7405]|uniref:F-box domain, Skp2-like protein n=1 Tax=Ascosphaera apis ARSEF 7405 TaxID=392613 RepID=A0A162IB57_9EURO|nr:F-box domain, Skp2-like protein [Ascosphaera apis ARSEF 7405]